MQINKKRSEALPITFLNNCLSSVKSVNRDVANHPSKTGYCFISSMFLWYMLEHVYMCVCVCVNGYIFNQVSTNTWKKNAYIHMHEQDILAVWYNAAFFGILRCIPGVNVHRNETLCSKSCSVWRTGAFWVSLRPWLVHITI